MSSVFSTIEKAIEDLSEGKLVIVVDDENRENEGDLVAIAENISADTVNFMAMHGRGLICVPLPDDRCDELDLGPMVENNTDPHQTAFTISVDLFGNGVTTGISASDRAKTIQALVDTNSKPADFQRPGHIFPLRARQGGVLRRAGHTEASIDLARLAGKKPAGVIVEIMNEDGTMARLPELIKMSKRFNLKIISIEQLISYRLERESLIRLKNHFKLNSPYGVLDVNIYEQTTSNQIHISFKIGDWTEEEEVLVRMQSGDVRESILDELQIEYFQHSNIKRALKAIQKSGSGVLVCLNQRKDQAYDLMQFIPKKESKEIPKSFGMDPLDYGVGAQILREINIKNVILLTNHPMKRVGIEGYGLHIVKNITLQPDHN